MALGIICVMPQVIFEVLRVPPFNVTAFDKSIDYQFRSEEAAIDFAMHNRNAAWVKINGNEVFKDA